MHGLMPRARRRTKRTRMWLLGGRRFDAATAARPRVKSAVKLSGYSARPYESIYYKFSLSLVEARKAVLQFCNYPSPGVDLFLRVSEVEPRRSRQAPCPGSISAFRCPPPQQPSDRAPDPTRSHDDVSRRWREPGAAAPAARAAETAGGGSPRARMLYEGLPYTQRVRHGQLPRG